MIRGLKYFLFFTLPMWGLKHDPWILPPYELEAEVEYKFVNFPDVNNGFNPSNYSTWQNWLEFKVAGSATSNLYAEVEVEFDNSKKVDFNFLSVAPSLKYQMLNDLAGDPVAFLVGAYFRYVPTNRLVDVATPYAGNYNFDFLFSVGKELDHDGKPVGRVYAYFDVGVATVGSPWFIGDVVAEAIFMERNVFRMGVDGYFGLGDVVNVNVNNFNGWAPIQHRSLEIKLGYQYNFPVYGSIRAMYARRVYAESYPEEANIVTIRYDITFSF